MSRLVTVIWKALPPGLEQFRQECGGDREGDRGSRNAELGVLLSKRYWVAFLGSQREEAWLAFEGSDGLSSGKVRRH